MKTQTSRRTLLAAALAVAGVFGLITSPAFADVHVSQNGATLTVTAPSTLAGKGLLLQTDAESSGTWTTAANIVGSVPAAGGIYTVDLAALGIANDTPCRIASATIYNRLDMLQMTNKNCYVDTGFLGTQVYGIRLGFYATGQSGNGTASTDYYYVMGCGKNGNTDGPTRGGIALMESLWGKDNGESGSKVRCIYRGADTSAATPTVKTDAINEYGITNRVFTINGTKISNLTGKNSLAWPAAEPVATNITYNIYLGRSGHNGTATGDNGVFAIFGWWSHVSFDDAEGNKILDYVPFERGDGTAGFWDYATSKFVTSGGSAPFKAGEQTGESFCTDVEGLQTFTANRTLDISQSEGTLTVTVPAGLVGERIVIAWDTEDKGDDLANWSHTANLTDPATAGTITTRLGRLGIRNGDIVRIFAANVYKPLDMLQMTTKQTYIDTGIKDVDVYGIRFGYYATGKSANFGAALGTGEGTSWNGGFIVGANNDTIESWYWAYQGTKYSNSGTTINRPTVSTSEINEAAFTNRVFSLGGVAFKTGLPAGAVAKTTDAYAGANMYLGRGAKSDAAMYGYWSHVSFDDASGNKILDYIPVQRVSDDKVGFYDRATLSFVTSSGTGNFTAGTVTNETPVIAVNACTPAFEITCIGGLIIMFR